MMKITNKEFEKLKEAVENIYWDYDRMSQDGKYFLDQTSSILDEVCINSKNKNKKKEKDIPNDKEI